MTDKSKLTQIAKYGSEEAYRAEMRRRRAMVKSHPGGGFRDKDVARAAQAKSVEARKKNEHSNTRASSPEEE